MWYVVASPPMSHRMWLCVFLVFIILAASSLEPDGSIVHVTESANLPATPHPCFFSSTLYHSVHSALHSACSKHLYHCRSLMLLLYPCCYLSYALAFVRRLDATSWTRESIESVVLYIRHCSDRYVEMPLGMQAFISYIVFQCFSWVRSPQVQTWILEGLKSLLFRIHNALSFTYEKLLPHFASEKSSEISLPTVPTFRNDTDKIQDSASPSSGSAGGLCITWHGWAWSFCSCTLTLAFLR